MIFVAQPLISKNAKKNILEALSSGWISSKGPFVENFEKGFAKFIGTKYGLTTTSGTTALHLALVAFRIGPGDEVIVPAFTMIAPLFAILYQGATPILVDSEINTWNMDVTQVEKKVTKRTKAIIAVHIYGQPVDMDPLRKIANRYNLVIVEDGAEALGATYKNKKVGTLGKISCFSFYSNKTITTGEGGMVTTDSKILYERMKTLKDMSHSKNRRFLHTSTGYNYRLTNLQAALGLSQLENIEIIIAKKLYIANRYNTKLNKISGLTLPPSTSWAKNIYWMYGVVVNKKSKLKREEITKILSRNGVETRDFFIPMHRQPALKKLGYFKNEKYPVADYLSKNGFYLPSGPKISNKEIDYISALLKEIL